ncbi:HNH endonuclease signature motif containing protein [Nocardia concava]|uniref:HNH endonuclease signature motif containing protein n=1 Tax=Nocardia concava TaxID=257281 RepID=UPI000307BA7C|nr:HNH endonuclease signature motif containing protein [Nocardia concava]
MTTGGGVSGSSTIADAIAMLAAATDILLTNSFGGFSDDEFVEFMQEYETRKRAMAAIDHRIVGEVRNRNLPEKAGWKKRTGKYLEQVLRLGHAEAGARVNAAEYLGERQVTGQVLEPTLAWVAAAQEQGLLSPDHARRIVKIMGRIPGKTHPELVGKAEMELAHFATRSTPDDLPKLGDRILGFLDPDGRLVSEDDRQARRGFVLGKQGVDGMSDVSGQLTPAARALLDAVFADLAQPGMCNPDDPQSPQRAKGIGADVLQAAARRDTRTTAQRQHDALIALLRPEMGPANLGQHRGLPVSTIITMSLAEVEAAAGVATTASGGTVPMEEALRLAEQSRPFLAIFDHAGRPLHFGHSKAHRLANADQRRALIAAERGCTRPGCDAPATLCAVHHVTEWAKGGPTDIENLTLACDSCHSLIGEGPDKWKTVVMPPESEHAGRIGWIAPASIDPSQTPQVNDRHHAGELKAASLTGIPKRTRKRPAVRCGLRP